LKAQPPKTYQKRFENCNSLHFKPNKVVTTDMRQPVSHICPQKIMWWIQSLSCTPFLWS